MFSPRFALGLSPQEKRSISKMNETPAINALVISKFFFFQTRMKSIENWSPIECQPLRLEHADACKPRPQHRDAGGPSTDNQKTDL